MNRILQAMVTPIVAVALPAAAVALSFDDPPADAPRATTILKQAVAVPAEKNADAPKADAGKAAPVKKDEEKKVEAKKEAMVKAQKAVVLQKAVQPNLDPMVQQYVPQFRPIMRGEIHFLRRACEPTKEQVGALYKLEDELIKAAAKEYVQGQQRPFIVNPQKGQQANVPPTPQGLLAKALTEYVDKHFDEKQKAAYRAELDKRRQVFREVAVGNLVATLDEDLVLSVEQREKITEELAKHWNDAWCRTLNSLMYGRQFFPDLPDDLVAKHLDATQKKVWAARPRNQGFIWADFSFNGDGMMLEEAEAPAVAPNDAARMRIMRD